MISRSERSTAGGFTLLEMLVVVAVLGAVLAGIGGVVGAPGGTGTLRLAAREIADGLRLARSQAIVENRTAAVAFNLAGGVWRVEPGAWRRMPDGVAAKLLTVRGQALGEGVGRIAFLPDGSSSGGRLALQGRGSTIAVGVDWLSGRVSLVEAR